MSPIPLPGATGITHLRVYDSVAPDGLCGGSPHVHFTCTEAYWIVKGSGEVHTLEASGYGVTTLGAGQLVWFSPGVIHRLVNLDGQLEILVVMQNAGLPEAGDFVLTFPDAVLADRAEYAGYAALASSHAVFVSGEEAARARRDLAVEGFNELCARFEAHGEVALRAFYERALDIVSPQFSRWNEIWSEGPWQAVNGTKQQLDALQKGDIEHLVHGQIQSQFPQQPRKLGMCGSLGTYMPEGMAVNSQ